MSDEIIAKLDELKQGQDGLRLGLASLQQDVRLLRKDQDGFHQGLEGLEQDVKLLRQGQDGLRLGLKGLQQDVRLLRQDQGDLRQGQGDLRADVAALRQEQDGMHKEVLRAMGESNENVMAALEALYASVQDHRVRMEKLERKVG